MPSSIPFSDPLPPLPSEPFSTCPSLDPPPLPNLVSLNFFGSCNLTVKNLLPTNFPSISLLAESACLASLKDTNPNSFERRVVESVMTLAETISPKREKRSWRSWEVMDGSRDLIKRLPSHAMKAWSVSVGHSWLGRSDEVVAHKGQSRVHLLSLSTVSENPARLGTKYLPYYLTIAKRPIRSST